MLPLILGVAAIGAGYYLQTKEDKENDGKISRTTIERTPSNSEHRSESDGLVTGNESGDTDPGTTESDRNEPGIRIDGDPEENKETGEPQPENL